MDAVPLERGLVIQPINSAKGVQLEHARHQAAVFDLGNPIDKHRKLIVMIFFGNTVTGVLDIPDAQVEAFPRAPQFLTGIFHSLPRACRAVDSSGSPLRHVKTSSAAIIAGWNTGIKRKEADLFGFQNNE